MRRGSKFFWGARRYLSETILVLIFHIGRIHLTFSQWLDYGKFMEILSRTLRSHEHIDSVKHAVNS